MDLSTLQTIGTFLGATLGGGFIGTVLSWIRENRQEKNGRTIEYVTSQLTLLYGPLWGLTVVPTTNWGDWRR